MVLLTESEPVPSVVPLEHHLLPFLDQLHQLLFDLTQAVIQSQLHIGTKAGYYPLRISIVEQLSARYIQAGVNCSFKLFWLFHF